MKKSIFISALAAVCIMAGCNKQEPNEDNGKDPGTSENQEVIDDSNALSPIEIQEKIDKVGNQFADEIAMSNWKQTADKIEAVAGTVETLLDEDVYDCTAIEEYADDIYNLFYSEDSEYIDGIYYDRYWAMVRLSSVKDHFTLEGNTWKRTKADDFQISFDDPKYGTVTATLKVIDDDNPIVILRGTESGDDWSEEYDISTYLPSSASLSISVGGTTVTDCVLKTSYVDSDKDGVLDTNDSISGSFDVTMDDYHAAGEFEISAKDINIKASSKHKSETLVSAALSIQGISSSVALSGDDIEGLEDSEFDSDDFNCQKLAFETIVMNELKTTVSCTQVKELLNQAEEMSECATAASAIPYAQKIEKLYDSALTIDNAKQASVGLEVLDDNGGWYAEPVLRFEDGSSYAFFEDFFTRNKFSTLVDKFEKLAEDIVDLFDEL